MRVIQKVIITVYSILVAVACIYVPWISGYGHNIIKSLGYSLLWEPVAGYEDVLNLSFVDVKRVLLEIIAITAVFGIFFVLTLKPKKVLPGS
jgi:hypothetical protein